MRILCFLGIVSLTGPMALPAVVEESASGDRGAQGKRSQTRLVGRRLSQVLIDLQSSGVQVVFTDRVVRPALRVQVEPRSEDPRKRLDELLGPHGLEAVSGPRGTWIVVEAAVASTDRSTSIRGLVRRGQDLRALAGATVRVVGASTRTSTGRDGSFAIPVGEAKRVSLSIESAGFLPASLRDIIPDSRLPIVVFLDRSPVLEEELLVTPSRVSVLDAGSGGQIALERDEIESLPHLGGDLFRAVGFLPGTTSNDVSAEFQVRGAHRSSTGVVLDGYELIDPFHLNDYDNAISILAAESLQGASLSTGGFPAQYGDRLAGVLDLTTRQPERRSEVRAGVSISSFDLGGAGSFGDRGHWMMNARHGSAGLIGRLLDEEDPDYWDGFGKVEYALSARHSLRLNALVAGDRFDFQENVDGDSKAIATSYDRNYTWLTHTAMVGSRWLAESTVGHTRIDRDRGGVESEEDVELEVDDRRSLGVTDLRHAWSWQVDTRHAIEFGASFRRLDAEFDYRLETRFDNPLAEVRAGGSDDVSTFVGTLVDENFAAYLSDRFVVGDRLTFEAGLRYDRYRLVDESHVSPRLNVGWRQGDSSFRLSWGRFVQSQRAHELLVEDDLPQLFPAERSSQWIVGWERAFASATGRPIVARLEAYHREVSNPRPRYENLYEPINTFPEAEPDRVRLDPDRGRAEGVELFVRRRSPRFGWWFNYTYSTTEDRAEGQWSPRSFDQTHAFNLNLDIGMGADWRLDLVWAYHTGWPTTPLEVSAIDEGDELEFVASLGIRNSGRLPDYHRLDLRIRREWERSWGSLLFYVDVQNAYDRDNPAGFDFEFDDEAGSVDRAVENWTGILPSAGVRLTF